jgi:hypothetical protein
MVGCNLPEKVSETMDIGSWCYARTVLESLIDRKLLNYVILNPITFQAV